MNQDPRANPRSTDEVTVKLDRASAAMVIGELLILVQAFEPIDGQYAARLQSAADAIALPFARP